jgi:hypothetical protein
MARNLKVAFFWNVTSCSSLCRQHCCGAVCLNALGIIPEGLQLSIDLYNSQNGLSRSIWDRTLCHYRASIYIYIYIYIYKRKLHGLSPRSNYTNQATASYRRSDCQLVRRGQRDGSLLLYSRFSRQEPLLLLASGSSVVFTRLSGPRSRPTTFFLNICLLILFLKAFHFCLPRIAKN